MIVVDTSAIMAVLLDETDAALYRLVLSQEIDIRLAAMTDLEVRIVAFNRAGRHLVDLYEQLVAEAGISTVEFGQRESLLAFDGFVRWGKGRQAAGLNFGDCAAYALAKSLDAPLLFKGTNFRKTDVRSAL